MRVPRAHTRAQAAALVPASVLPVHGVRRALQQQTQRSGRQQSLAVAHHKGSAPYSCRAWQVPLLHLKQHNEPPQQRQQQRQQPFPCGPSPPSTQLTADWPA